MTRRSDWPERLALVLAAWQRTPFLWGQRDCAHFALACVQAVSARDWAQLELPHYTSARGAARVLRRLGVADVAALADLLLGLRLHPDVLGRGDLLLVDGTALGVCFGEKIWAMSETGLTAHARERASAGWRI